MINLPSIKRRVRLFFVVAFCLVSNSAAVAQLVYSVDNSGIVSIDPATGAMSAVAPLPVTGIQIGSSFDHAGRRLFFRGSLGGNTVLVSFFVDTGVSTLVPAPGTFAFTEYDPLSGLVYSVTSSGIVSINPITGTMTTVAPLPVTSLNIGSSFDRVGRRLFFRGSSGGDTMLVSFFVDTATATLVPAPGIFGFNEYISTSGLVYSVDSSGIVSINPVTGAMNNVAPLPISSVQIGSSFDHVAQRIFFRGSSGGGTLLVSFFTDTNADVQVPAPGTFGFTEFVPAVAAAVADIPVLNPVLLALLAVILALLAFVRLLPR